MVNLTKYAKLLKSYGGDSELSFYLSEDRTLHQNLSSEEFFSRVYQVHSYQVISTFAQIVIPFTSLRNFSLCKDCFPTEVYLSPLFLDENLSSYLGYYFIFDKFNRYLRRGSINLRDLYLLYREFSTELSLLSYNKKFTYYFKIKEKADNLVVLFRKRYYQLAKDRFITSFLNGAFLCQVSPLRDIFESISSEEFRDLEDYFFLNFNILNNHSYILISPKIFYRLRDIKIFNEIILRDFVFLFNINLVDEIIKFNEESSNPLLRESRRLSVLL